MNTLLHNNKCPPEQPVQQQLLNCYKRITVPSLFRNCILHRVAGQIVVKLRILVITTDVKLQFYTLQTVITLCGIIGFTTWQWCSIKTLEKNATILSGKTIDVQMGLFCRDIQVYRVLSKPACQYYSNNTYKHKVIWKAKWEIRFLTWSNCKTTKQFFGQSRCPVARSVII